MTEQIMDFMSEGDYSEDNVSFDEYAGRTAKVCLFKDTYCDIERTVLFEVKNIKMKDRQQSNNVFRKVNFNPGFPRVLDAWRFPHYDGNKAKEETFYRVEWTNRNHQGSKIVSEHDLDTGEWLAHWGGIPITSRGEKDYYANIVKSQIERSPWNIPMKEANDSTGFHKDSKGDWVYILRDGRCVTKDASIVDYGIPLNRYNFSLHKKHAESWQEWQEKKKHSLYDLPDDLTKREDTIYNFLLWHVECDEKLRSLILCLASYRSLIHTFVPLSCAILVVAHDSLDAFNGSSGAGKTSTINFARGVDGPCPYRADGEASFSGKPTGIETRIAGVRDLPISVSDSHMSTANPTEKEMSDYANKLNKLITSAADGEEMQQRGTVDIKARKGNHIDGLLIVDMEKFYITTLSRLRRFAILQYRCGEINNKKLHDEWNQYQEIHTAIGHAIIRWVTARVNEDVNAFKKEIEEKEANYKEKFLHKIRPMYSKEALSDEIKDALSDVYARVATGVYLLEQATKVGSDTEEESIVESFIFKDENVFLHLKAQADMAAKGSPSSIDKEWIIKTTVKLLNEGRCYAADMRNEPLTGGKEENYEKFGYHRDYNPSTGSYWITSQHGRQILNVSDDKEDLWFDNEAWRNALQNEAERQHKPWMFNEKTFPAFLVEGEIIIPDKGGRSAQLAYIAGKRSRRLYLKAETLGIPYKVEGTEENEDF